MQQFKLLGVALGAALLVAACGGGGDGNQIAPVTYSKVVSFGDSLSDAGSYKVGVAASGGQFTVNGFPGDPGSSPTPSYTWAQLVSASVTGAVGCAARTGGFGVLETTVPPSGCWNYAQGGARVADKNGIGNMQGGGAGVGSVTVPTNGIYTGALTEPVTTQLANYLTDAKNNNKFTGDELVTVLAGPNDVFAALDGATATGNNDFPVELAKLLVADIAPAVTDPATVGADVTTIAKAFGTAIAAGGSANDGALAAVQTAAGLGSTNALYIMTVIGTAQATANATATAGTAAWSNAFVGKLTTQFVADVPAANQAAAATAIPTAFSNTYAAALTAGKSAASAQNLGLLTASQAAADAGNTKVRAVLGTTDKTIPGNIGNATAAAHTYAANWVLAQAKAAADALATAVTGMVTAGAKHVVVLNLPDMSLTPSGQSQDPTTQQLIYGASVAFNTELQTKLGVTTLGVPVNGVLLVDFFTNMQNNVNDPTHYGLVAGTTINPATGKPRALLTPVCNETLPTGITTAITGISAGGSLICNRNNITLPTTGSTDIEHFMFADGVHPTPYGHKLLAQVVNKIMIQAGWL